MKKLQLNKTTVRRVLTVLGVLAVMGIGAVLNQSYHATIDHIKADGVREYQQNTCAKYSKDKAVWLECDVRK